VWIDGRELSFGNKGYAPSVDLAAAFTAAELGESLAKVTALLLLWPLA